MDGKAVYIWLGHAIYAVTALIGLSRPSLVLVFGLYSAIFASLTTVNLYVIYTSIFGEKYMGLASAFLTIFSPIGFVTSLLIVPYPLALFFVTLAVAAWLGERYVTWSLALALAICTHASSILLAAAWVGVILTSHSRIMAVAFVKHLPILLLVCVGFFGWVISFFPSLDSYVQFNLFVTAKDYLQPITGWNWLISRGEALIQSNGLLLLMFSGLGLCVVVKGRTANQKMLTWWFTPYLIFYLVWPQAGGKFYIFLLPPLSLTATAGISYAARSMQTLLHTFVSEAPKRILTRRRALFLLSLILVIVTLASSLTQGYASVARMRDQPNEYAQLGIAMNVWAAKEDFSANTLIISGWEAHYVIFYTPKLRVVGWYGSLFPVETERIASLVLSTINQAHACQQRVFMTYIWYRQESTRDPSITQAVNVISTNFRIVQINAMLFEIL
jgi:hypothetical protein